jgi:sulfate permease, SulP family
VAGMVHALTLLVIMLVAGRWAAMIPMACLAGILVVVAWNMAEVHSFLDVFRTSRYDMAVLLVTFVLTVVFDLVIAIEIGMVLAAFLFMKRMSDTAVLKPLAGLAGDGDDPIGSEVKGVPRDVLIYEINGPLFFGAAQTFMDTLKTTGDRHRVLILRMRHVPFIDATGLHRLKDIVKTMGHRGVRVLLSDVRPAVRHSIRDAGILQDGMVLPSVEEALKQVARSGEA